MLHLTYGYAVNSIHRGLVDRSSPIQYTLLGFCMQENHYLSEDSRPGVSYFPNLYSGLRLERS